MPVSVVTVAAVRLVADRPLAVEWVDHPQHGDAVLIADLLEPHRVGECRVVGVDGGHSHHRVAVAGNHGHRPCQVLHDERRRRVARKLGAQRPRRLGRRSGGHHSNTRTQ
ncbi:MAG: hypothetical protein B7Z68_12165 [Acidobacteria bacterium 21-70-11]|nr:MAG: hypothetical protein B7Z68_12165 [Acidobacteria bacterium 21-70-11]